jgi:diguanylate cyclase (GGDEF)-like protein
MRRGFWVGLVAVAAIAVGSIVGALVVGANERDSFDALQKEEATRAAHQTEALAALSVGQLDSAAAFYQAEEGFGHHEFKVIAQSLFNAGALDATAYVQAVPDARRALYERTHDYRIREKVGINLRRAQDRPYYFPLTYVESRDGTPGTPFGYDLGADPSRRPYLLHARDSGNAIATRAISLLVGGTGINVYRPVYRDGAPTATVAQRRAALIGFAAGAFRVDDLAAAAETALPDDIAIQLRDRGHSIFGPEQPLDEADDARLNIANNSWVMVISDPDKPGVTLPVMMAVFGISLAALLGALILIWSRSERMRDLQQQASSDSLTGLTNRRRFEDELRRELARARRDGSTGAVLMLDIDNFKRINDTLGHPIGDKVIEEIAKVFAGRTREADVIARIGGDEFAMVLPSCDVIEAVNVGDEMARAVRDHVPAEDGVPRMTVSVGIAVFGRDADLTFEQVMTDADAALYEAKEAGRDGVRLAGAERR